MNNFHISEAAERLGVSPGLLRRLEREGKVQLARRDFNGRIYNEFDLAVLRAQGIGQRPERYRRPEDVFSEVFS